MSQPKHSLLSLHLNSLLQPYPSSVSGSNHTWQLRVNLSKERLIIMISQHSSREQSTMRLPSLLLWVYFTAFDGHRSSGLHLGEKHGTVERVYRRLILMLLTNTEQSTRLLPLDIRTSPLCFSHSNRSLYSGHIRQSNPRWYPMCFPRFTFSFGGVISHYLREERFRS